MARAKITGKFLDKFSIASKSLRDQLSIAFVLMTILPMMALSYFLVIYLIPNITTSENIFLVFLCSLALSLAGFAILMKIMRSIIGLRQYVENVAMGNLNPPEMHDHAAEVDDIIELVNRIHQKLQDEEQARAKMEKAAIIEAMPDPLFVIDLDGMIMFTNPAQEKVFGRKAETIIGKRFDQLQNAIRPEDIKKFAKLPGKAMETGEGAPLEIAMMASDGREIPASVRYSLLKDAKGKPMYIVAVLRDITELKRAAEKELELVVVAAEAAAEKKRAAELAKAYQELRDKSERLKRFNRVAVDQELEMVRLEEEVNALLIKSGLPRKYETPAKIKQSKESISIP